MGRRSVWLTVACWFNAGVDLHRRWPLDGALDGSRNLRAQLLAAWADPARGYHDTLHLTEVLIRLDELAAHGTTYDRRVVELAAWFHDGVYDGLPGAEERSAQWAERALAPLLPPAETAEVARLVRLTETHRPADADRNGGALSDADLAILAAPSERYASYVAAVRHEYADVPDEAFAAGRATVLRDLLAKERLFATAYAHQHWEAPARTNVAEELTRLEAGTG